MLQGFSASLAEFFTCSLLLLLQGARLSVHALSSQARHKLEVRTIMFWTLTISSMNCTFVTFAIPAISGNFCNTEFQAQLDINGY